MKLSLNTSRYVTGALSTAILAAGAVTFTPSVAQAVSGTDHGGYVMKIKDGGCITPSGGYTGADDGTGTIVTTLRGFIAGDCDDSRAVWHVLDQNGKLVLSTFSEGRRYILDKQDPAEDDLTFRDRPEKDVVLAVGGPGDLSLRSNPPTGSGSFSAALKWSDDHLISGDISNVTLENLKGEKVHSENGSVKFPSRILTEVLPKPHISANCHWGTPGVPSKTWFKSIDAYVPQLPDGYTLPEGTRVVVASQDQNVILNYPLLPVAGSGGTVIGPSVANFPGWSTAKTFDQARTNGDGTKYVRFENGGIDTDAHKNDGSVALNQSLDYYNVFFVSPDGFRSEPAQATLANNDLIFGCSSKVTDNGDIRPNLPSLPNLDGQVRTSNP